MYKILTNEELKIVELFKNNVFAKYTIRDIMLKIGKKSYNWVFRAVKKIENFGIIKITSVGGSNVCSLNFDSLIVFDYFAIMDKFKVTKQFPMKNVVELINIVPLDYFTFVVAGSYAKNKATKNSDLDVVVIIENKSDVKKVFSVLKNKGDLMIPKIHLLVFSKDDFLRMLLDKGENYGKEVFRNCIIFFGAENYYKILKKAKENGFKG